MGKGKKPTAKLGDVFSLELLATLRKNVKPKDKPKEKNIRPIERREVPRQNCKNYGGGKGALGDAFHTEFLAILQKQAKPKEKRIRRESTHHRLKKCKSLSPGFLEEANKVLAKRGKKAADEFIRSKRDVFE